MNSTNIEMLPARFSVTDPKLLGCLVERFSSGVVKETAERVDEFAEKAWPKIEPWLQRENGLLVPLKGRIKQALEVYKEDSQKLQFAQEIHNRLKSCEMVLFEILRLSNKMGADYLFEDETSFETAKECAPRCVEELRRLSVAYKEASSKLIRYLSEDLRTKDVMADGTIRKNERVLSAMRQVFPDSEQLIKPRNTAPLQPQPVVSSPIPPSQPIPSAYGGLNQRAHDTLDSSTIASLLEGASFFDSSAKHEESKGSPV